MPGFDIEEEFEERRQFQSTRTESNLKSILNYYGVNRSILKTNNIREAKLRGNITQQSLDRLYC